MSDFVQRHVFHATAQVTLHGLREGRDDVATQERAIAGQWVGNFDADLLSGVGVKCEVLVVFVAHERIAQGLHHAVFGEFVGHLALAQLLGGQSDLGFDRCRRHGDRNLIVADQTGHFLHQIARFVEVRTPARRSHGELTVATAGHSAADIGGNVADGVHVSVQSRHAGHFGRLEQNRTTIADSVVISRVLARLAVAILDQKLGGHLGGSRLQLIIHATLETTGRFGRNLVTTCRTRDRHLVEMSGFQQDVLSFSSDLAIQAAHHAGDAKHTRATLAVRRVGDQQVFDAQVMILAVQCGELLTFVGAAHDDRSFNLVQIVGMHRLAKIKHHVIGDVHRQRDGAHACAD